MSKHYGKRHPSQRNSGRGEVAPPTVAISPFSRFFAATFSFFLRQETRISLARGIYTMTSLRISRILSLSLSGLYLTSYCSRFRDEER
jgi:hypothetical protein